MRLSAQGITVEVPQGWDGEIYRRSAGLQAQSGERSGTVMHLGNFPLPSQRGDYGSGAVEVMNADGILIVLFEFGRESVGKALFSHQGLPIVSADDVAPQQMQRPIDGQSGVQYFFNHAGRAFCLYVALGSHTRRHELVPEVNQVLSSLDLDTL